jgi:hypothetical protein
MGRRSWAHEKGKRNSLRFEILSELGRIPDDEDLRAGASQICKPRPRTKDAITIIRFCRTG